MIHKVVVEATWKSEATFEFDTEEEAKEFYDRVATGSEDGLDAIIENGDIFSHDAWLSDWEAISWE